MEPRYMSCHHDNREKKDKHISVRWSWRSLCWPTASRSTYFAANLTQLQQGRRETAWEKIAARVNAPTGEKRTWKQLKMKHKNIIQKANRKKAEARKTGGGPPPPPPLTEAEELALSQNRGCPVAEGIPGGSSSEPVTPQDTSAYIRCKYTLMSFKKIKLIYKYI
ncbi:hypothetical protein N1851_013469 [Merluccius polli]|uniref:Myb/SANT-like DNA-binding domain-containing protein n=1 Tax=Merluccius polli TaxID=89951 RepID=A0AA47P4C1_MERPO|nr:hypothetical protein N1851_013469 [Merluccius polli]